MEAENTQASQPAKSNLEIITHDRKKLNLLKRAVINERDEKDREAKEARDIESRLGLLDLMLSEKVTFPQESQIQILSIETQEIMQKLQQERAKRTDANRRASISPIRGGKKSMLALEMENKKLLEEYHELKLRFEEAGKRKQEVQR